MNLGGVYRDVFLLLAAGGGLMGVVLGVLIARWCVRALRWRVAIVVVAAIGGIVVANAGLHHAMFKARHQAQNDVIPKGVECLSYEPAMEGLEASYRMTQEEFLQYVNGHSWGLQPTDRVWFRRDGKLVTEFAGLKYATDMSKSSRGAQLRAYHEGDVAWISYSAW